MATSHQYSSNAAGIHGSVVVRSEMDNTALRHVRRATKLNGFFGYDPYGWSQKSRGRVTFTVKISTNAYSSISKSACTYEAFLTIRALYVTFMLPGHMSVSTRVDLQFFPAGNSPLPFQLCSVVQCDQFHVMLNRYLSFQKELQIEWDQIGPKKKCKSVGTFIRLGLANSLTFLLLDNSSNFVGQAIFKFRQRLTWFSVSHL